MNEECHHPVLGIIDQIEAAVGHRIAIAVIGEAGCPGTQILVEASAGIHRVAPA